MTNWKKYKLGEVINLKRGYDLPQQNRIHGNIPIYSSAGLSGYHNEFKVKGPGVITGRYGTLGQLFYTDQNYWPHNTTLYVKDFKGNHPKFIYYFLKTLRLDNQNDKTSVPGLNRNHLHEIEVTIPKDIHEQQRIASILSSLDDKIELNHRMNQTLEQIAATLFKKYFVDDIDPDNLPEGWRVRRIEDIADVIDCLHSKKPERIDFENTNILLQLENILDNGLLDLSSKFHITDEDYKKWISRIEVSFGDCVITNVGRSGVAARIPNGVKVAMGRNMTAIRLKKQFNYPAFLITLLTSDFMKTEIQNNIDVGTILNALNVRSIPKLKFYFPTNSDIIENIEKQLSPLWLLMETNLREINKLSSIRNTLLPKLMSGEIDVTAINQNVPLHEEVLI